MKIFKTKKCTATLLTILMWGSVCHSMEYIDLEEPPKKSLSESARAKISDLWRTTVTERWNRLKNRRQALKILASTPDTPDFITNVQAIAPDKIAQLTPEQIAALPETAFYFLTHQQFQALQPEQVSQLDEAQLKLLKQQFERKYDEDKAWTSTPPIINDKNQREQPLADNPTYQAITKKLENLKKSKTVPEFKIPKAGYESARKKIADWHTAATDKFNEFKNRRQALKILTSKPDTPHFAANVQKITPETITKLTPEEIAALPDTAFQSFTNAQLQALQPNQISLLHYTQLERLQINFMANTLDLNDPSVLDNPTYQAIIQKLKDLKRDYDLYQNIPELKEPKAYDDAVSLFKKLLPKTSETKISNLSSLSLQPPSPKNEPNKTWSPELAALYKEARSKAQTNEERQAIDRANVILRNTAEAQLKGKTPTSETIASSEFKSVTAEPTPSPEIEKQKLIPKLTSTARRITDFATRQTENINKYLFPLKHAQSLALSMAKRGETIPTPEFLESVKKLKPNQQTTVLNTWLLERLKQFDNKVRELNDRMITKHPDANEIAIKDYTAQETALTKQLNQDIATFKNQFKDTIEHSNPNLQLVLIESPTQPNVKFFEVIDMSKIDPTQPLQNQMKNIYKQGNITSLIDDKDQRYTLAKHALLNAYTKWFIRKINTEYPEQLQEQLESTKNFTSELQDQIIGILLKPFEQPYNTQDMLAMAEQLNQFPRHIIKYIPPEAIQKIITADNIKNVSPEVLHLLTAKQRKMLNQNVREQLTPEQIQKLTTLNKMRQANVK